MSAWFFFWQSKPETTWRLALADHREQVRRDQSPPFTTILELDSSFEGDMTKEQLDAIRYRGDFYLDFDSKSIEEVIPKFQEFLGKLTELKVDTHAIRLWATGGKGFHVVIPSSTFIAKPNPRGTPALGAIYREMAMELYVETLDLSIYSARRGRMFREENILRTNGKYKVRITPAEALAMTPATYDLLCSAPRLAPPTSPATLNNELALIYSKAADKVDGALKRRKSSKADESLLKKFKGNFPPSLLAVMDGTVPSPVGFQKIATQIAITADALKIPGERVLELCGGLLANHKSDGTRYNSPGKRRAELLRMCNYMQDNPCYTFSAGAVKSLMPADTPAPDLGDTGGEDGSDAIRQGVYMTEEGIFRRTEEGDQVVSDLSFKDPVLLYDLKQLVFCGYELTVVRDGKDTGRSVLSMESFQTKQKLHQFALSQGGIMQGPDSVAASIAHILRKQAEGAGRMTYTWHREGLDFIQHPEVKDKRQTVAVWLAHDCFQSSIPKDSQEYFDLKLKPLDFKVSNYRSDLHNAPKIGNDEVTRGVLHALLNLHDPESLGPLFGWFVGAFMKQLYIHNWEQFPICQVYGQAGSGKSTVVSQLMYLHFFERKPPDYSALGTTPFMLENAAQGSASIPLWIEEYKPSQIAKKKGQLEKLWELIKLSYRNQGLSKGTVYKESGSSHLGNKEYEISAPICLVGEHPETQSAIVERTIPAAFEPRGHEGKEGNLSLVQRHREVVSSLGKLLVSCALRINYDDFAETFEVIRREVKTAEPKMSQRPLYNRAVVLHALEFLRRALRTVFEEEFDADIDRLKGGVLAGSGKSGALTAIAEPVRALSSLAYLSSLEMSQSEFGLQPGIDYISRTPKTGKGETFRPWIELKLQNCFYKYLGWCRRMGQQPLYQNEQSFVIGLQHYKGIVDRFCADSPLRDKGIAKVFRLDVQTLLDDGVDHFRGGD